MSRSVSGTRPRRHAWPFSTADMYRRCPRQYRYRYVDGIDGAGPRPSERQRLGVVLHAAAAEAYRYASDATSTMPSSTARMIRFEAHAKRVFASKWPDAGLSWENQGLVHDGYRILTEYLAALPVPWPGQIAAVERQFTGRTPGGIEMPWRPDLVLRRIVDGAVSDRHYEIVDHKLGHVADVDPMRDHQLVLYAWMLARMLPDVVAVRLTLRSMAHPTEFVSADADPEVMAVMIEGHERTALTALADETFEARPGEHCRSCFARLLCPVSAAPYPLPGDVVAGGERR